MIVTRLTGGLGNQIFQYAFGRYLAHKHNTQLKLDVSYCNQLNGTHHDGYNLGKFNIIENFATEEDIKNLQVVEQDLNKRNVFIPDFLNCPDDVYLKGLWFNENYFPGMREILQRELTLKDPLHENSADWEKKILSAKNPVALHVRHGDLLKWELRANVFPREYYYICVNELKKFYSEITLFIFSDDIDWVKDNLKFDVPAEYVENCEIDEEEFYLMSICKHNILCGSSFSWWAAWLNKNPDKKILINRVTSLVETPESWIKISVEKPKVPFTEFPPALSIILSVEDNAANLPVTLQSLLSQQFRDYEIILADSGRDNFCRQLAAYENVNYLKINRSADRNEILNMALECAAGDYVLFLSNNNFILQNASSLLFHCWDYDFNKSFNTRKNYINAKNYSEIGADIICSVQYLEENISGDTEIGLPDKKFLLKVDEPFKNFDGITEIKIEPSQKLVVIGTGQINNLLSTKFFKRKFLNDNKIRFTNSDLLFLMEWFMKTDKIYFVSQSFSGIFK